MSRGGDSQEEKLLAELLVTNQELLDALQMYDDLVRVGVEQVELQRKQAEFKVRHAESTAQHSAERSRSNAL